MHITRKHRAFLYALMLIIAGLFITDIILINAVFNYHKNLKWIKTDPWNREFYENENLKLEKKGNRCRILLAGDSRIYQWKDIPAIEGCEIINRGISGETTAGLLLRFENDVIALRPDVVVIETGINDLTTIGVWPARYDFIKSNCIANLDKIIDVLKEKKIDVIILTVFPSSDVSIIRRIVWSHRIEKAVKEVNEHIKMINKKGVSVINCDAIFISDNGLRDELYTDTLHINRLAYYELNNKIQSAVKEIIRKRKGKQ